MIVDPTGQHPVILSRRSLEILRLLETCGDELAYSQGMGYLGNMGVSARVISNLLRACAISTSLVAGSTEYYKISATGREILAEAARRAADKRVRANRPKKGQ